MSGLQVDPTNRIKMKNFAATLNNTQVILENSKPIFLSSGNAAITKLEKTILYGDITMEQLSLQLARVEGLIEASIINDVPLEPEAQHNMIDLCDMIKHRIMGTQDMTTYTNSIWQAFYMTSITRDTDGNCCSINQEEIEKIFIGGDTSKLEDILRLIESEDIEQFNPEIVKFLIMAIIEDIIDPVKLSEVLVDKCIKPIEQAIENPLDTMEIIEAIRLIFEEFEHIFAANPPRLTYLDSLKSKVMERITSLESCITLQHDPYMYATRPNLEAQFISNLCDMATAVTEQQIIDGLNEFSRMQTLIESELGEEILTEASRHGGNRRKIQASIARKTNKVVNGTVKGIQKAGSTVKHAKKKTIDPMERFIEDTFNKIKSSDIEKRKEIVIKGGIVPKVLRFIKRSVAIGAVGIVSPTIAGISLLTYLATNKTLNNKAKKQVLTELESELTLVNEKIEDSKGDDDKQKKYELIRIKQKLEKDIIRIRHGIE